MKRTLCKSKIHKAIVTEANVRYEGSITIDRTVMDAADLLPFERVQVASIRTGTRLETYVIEGAVGSGVIAMNGAAAKMIGMIPVAAATIMAIRMPNDKLPFQGGLE